MPAFATGLVAALLLGWTCAIRRTVAAAERRAGLACDAGSTLGGRIALVVATGAALVAANGRPPGPALAMGLACIALVVAAPSDLRHGLLFDAVTTRSALAVAVAVAVAGDPLGAAIGVLSVAGAFYALVVVSRGRLMGLGDVKAIVSIGAAFGPLGATIVIFTACLSGIAYAAATRRLAVGRSIAFGPHLALGCLATLVCGSSIERFLAGSS